MTHGPREHKPATSAESVDNAIFADFIVVVGPSQARFWLGQLRQNLLTEIVAPVAQLPARDNVHRICGRAGMMGFLPLHNACQVFLETGDDHADKTAIYKRLQSEAHSAVKEIDRQHSLLG